MLWNSNLRAFALCHRTALPTTEPFCHDTDSLWHKYIAWFLKRQRTCQMKIRNKFCCVCTTGACVNNFLMVLNKIYISACSCRTSLPSEAPLSLYMWTCTCIVIVPLIVISLVMTDKRLKSTLKFQLQVSLFGYLVLFHRTSQQNICLGTSWCLVMAGFPFQSPS
jgi:hypothetical protein